MNTLLKKLFFLIFFASACSVSDAQFDSRTKTVNVAGYITSTTDHTTAVANALNDCKLKGARKLVFPKGVYHFRPDSLKPFMTYISNNGDYSRCFAFDLTGARDLEIDGGGSTFMFKGYVCPFYVNHASDITLRNFTVDYERTFHSEGHIVQTTQEYMDVRFSKEYPYYIDDQEHLRFVDDEGVEYPWFYMLEFDPKKMETAYMAADQWTGGSVKASDLGNRTVRLHREGLKGQVGNVINFGMAYRKVPVITVTDSKNFTLHNVTLYHGGGMGVIAQRSRNLLLDSLVVTPAPGKDRVVSAAADATHFVNCSGYIRMYDCHFANQTDDATNIHGVYYRIADILPDNRIMVELANSAQYGFFYLKRGMKLEFVNAGSLITYAHNKIKSVYSINDRKFMVTLNSPLSSKTKKGDAIAGCDEYPDVHIKGCYFGNNRARGLLLGSRAKMLIENNTFHTPGSALLLEGDARGWFEQAGVRNVIIRNNTFDNCNFANWNKGTIGCGSGIDQEYFNSSYYNRNLLIENNTFIIHRTPVVYLYSVDGITFRNNRITASGKDYPCTVDKSQSEKLFELKECTNFTHDDITIQ